MALGINSSNLIHNMEQSNNNSELEERKSLGGSQG
jgi:hypothetical protein